MHKLMLIAAVAALSACNKNEATAPANDANVAAIEAPAVTPAAMSLNETTWTFTDKDGKKIEESIDASGNYISTVGAAHDDHGTVAMVDGKACFTSKMDKDGPSCWTVVDTAIGATTETVSDKGEKLMVTRVAYVAKTMPAAS